MTTRHNSCTNFELPELIFDERLLTTREQNILEASWDGSTLLMDQLPKRLTVAVHSGEAHADDALSVALLILFSGAIIDVLRTRDPLMLETADLRVDVGEGLLDHHGERSCGKGSGIAACTRVMQLLENSNKLPKAAVEPLWEVVDQVAARDTGTDVCAYPFPWFFPAWKAGIRRLQEEDTLFLHLVSRICCDVRDIAENAVAAAEAQQEAEEIIDRNLTAKVVSFTSETRDVKVKELLWKKKAACVFFVSPETEDDWRVLCACPTDKEYSDFGSRQLIPQKFCGLRGDALSEATGIEGGIFAHKDGFIAGFKTEDAAVRFAQLCLES